MLSLSIGQEVHVHLRVWYIQCAVFSSPNAPSPSSSLPFSSPPFVLPSCHLPPHLPPHTHTHILSSTCCVVWLKSMWTTGESIQSTLMDTILMMMSLSGSGRYSRDSVSTLSNQTRNPTMHNSTVTVLCVHLQCACGISLQKQKIILSHNLIAVPFLKCCITKLPFTVGPHTLPLM